MHPTGAYLVVLLLSYISRRARSVPSPALPPALLPNLFAVLAFAYHCQRACRTLQQPASLLADSSTHVSLATGERTNESWFARAVLLTTSVCADFLGFSAILPSRVLFCYGFSPLFPHRAGSRRERSNYSYGVFVYSHAQTLSAHHIVGFCPKRWCVHYIGEERCVGAVACCFAESIRNCRGHAKVDFRACIQ